MRFYLVFISLSLLILFSCNAENESPATFAIHVYTKYPGASAESVENLITKPIERTLANVNGLLRMESISADGVSVVMLEFADSTNSDALMWKIHDLIENVKSSLPQNLAEEPNIYVVDESWFPALTIEITNRDQDLVDFDEQARILEDDLLTYAEVEKVNSRGLAERYILIELDRMKLKKAGLITSDVARALSAENLTSIFGSNNYNYININQSFKIESITSAGFCIRLDVTDFDDLQMIEETVIQGDTRVLLKDISNSVQCLGENLRPYSIEFDISKKAQISIDVLHDIATRELHKHPILSDWIIREIEPPAAYDFFNIYPDLQETTGGCEYHIDRAGAASLGISSLSISSEIISLQVLYPDLSPEELLEMPYQTRSDTGKIIEFTLNKFVTLKCP